jgi:glycolate oxidase iron-sulfur subunit
MIHSVMKKLLSLIRQLEDQLCICTRCGMCQAVCPLFAETGRETDVARGKLALLDGLLKDMFEDAKGVNDRLNKCLLCGSCAANCPSGVNVLNIFLKARAILAGFIGLSPIKKIIFRNMLANPETFDKLMEWGTRFQKIFTKPINNIEGTSCARFETSFLKGRHFRALSQKPFHLIIPELNTLPGKSGLKVGLFIGCLIDKFFPNIAKATLNVLAYHDVGVFLPGSQGCCAMPAISSGDIKTFTQLVEYNLAKFEQSSFDYLVTSCATCTSTIKNIWPAFFRDNQQFGLNARQLAARIENLAEKTMDISQFLVAKVGIKPFENITADNKSIITYHDPCHLKKSMGIFEEPRELIRANPAYQLKEMVENDWCCGFGGSFNFKYYDISESIGDRKSRHIRNTGGSVVATSCPACMMQLSDVLSKGKCRIKIKHSLEIYEEILNNQVASTTCAVIC